MKAMTPPFVAPRARALTGLWLVTAVLTGLPALFLRSFAEDATARLAALLLLLSAGVALATGFFVGRGTRRTLQVSLAASALVMVAAGSALAALASKLNLDPRETLMFGGVAIVGAVVTAIVAGSRLHRGARSTPE